MLSFFYSFIRARFLAISGTSRATSLKRDTVKRRTSCSASNKWQSKWHFGILLDFALKKSAFLQPWLAFNSLYFHPQLVLLTIVLLAAFGNDGIRLTFGRADFLGVGISFCLTITVPLILIAYLCGGNLFVLVTCQFIYKPNLLLNFFLYINFHLVWNATLHTLFLCQQKWVVFKAVLSRHFGLEKNMATCVFEARDRIWTHSSVIRIFPLGTATGLLSRLNCIKHFTGFPLCKIRVP